MKTNRIIDLSKTGYCQPGGLGAGSDQCKCRVKQSEKRFAFGGPDIASELLKEMTASKPELSIVIPDSVNSLEKLSKFIIESGYQRNTPEYLELYSKYRGGLQSECSYL